MIRNILIALCLMCVAQPAFAAGRGYLGVWFGILSEKEKAAQTGVTVNKVFAGSAAEQAGLKPGEIVTQINGVFVRDPKTAVGLVAESAAGERIWLTVIDTTGGAVRQFNVFATLAANPPSGFASIMTAKPKPRPRHLSTSSTARHCVGSATTRDPAMSPSCAAGGIPAERENMGPK
jgi:predicted metalloprotease with PDZ domain